jgi:uncharacterized membrane protein YgcG
VTAPFLLAYAIAWATETMGLIVLARWQRETRSRPPHPVVTSFLAGAVWPVLLLGLVQYGMLAVASKIIDEAEGPATQGIWVAARHMPASCQYPISSQIGGMMIREPRGLQNGRGPGGGGGGGGATSGGGGSVGCGAPDHG